MIYKVYSIFSIFFFLVESNRATIVATSALSDLHRAEQERLLNKIVDLNGQVKAKSQVRLARKICTPLLMFYWGMEGGMVFVKLLDRR